MKPLYWTRILAAPPAPLSITITPVEPDDLTPDVLDGTAISPDEDQPSVPPPPAPPSASSPLDSPTAITPDGDPSSQQPVVLWQQIDETPLADLSEFTELFARRAVAPVKPKIDTEKHRTKVQTIKVFDSKRSQSVGIFARSIHVEFCEVENAIYQCDTSVVSLEQLTQIMAMRATDEELAQIREAAQMGGVLDSPEEFLLRVANCSYSAERISCIVFQAEFDEKCSAIVRKLDTLMQLCALMLESRALRDLLSIVLTLGNYMNGGNQQRGQADGFGLEILGKLKDVKSSDSRTTLLHYVVKTYVAECRWQVTTLAELPLPVPHPVDVKQAMGVDFGEVEVQVRELQDKLKGESTGWQQVGWKWVEF